MTKEKTLKDQVLEFLLLFFIYLVVSSFPWKLVISDIYLSTSIRLLIGSLFLIGSIIFIHLRYPLQKRHIPFKTVLFFLPFFLIVFSNLASKMFSYPPMRINDPVYLLLTIASTIVFAISEELLFRRMLLPLLLNNLSELKSLLLSSLIFAVLHLLNMLDGYSLWPALLQVLYTFGVGLICGLMYLYGQTIWLPIIFHISFNIFQNDLYEALYSDYSADTVWTTAIAILFGVFYGLLTYLLFGRTKPSSSEDRPEE